MINWLWRLRHVFITLVAFLVVGLFAGVALNLSFMNPIARALENFSFADVYFQMQLESHEKKENSTITLVDMTELRLRRKLAQLLDDVHDLQPKVIGVDILFMGELADEEGNLMVEAAAARCADNTIFSYTLNDYQEGQFQKEVHSFFIDEVPVTEGFSGYQRSLYSDMKRTVSLGRPSKGAMKPSFPLQMANSFSDKDVIQAEDHDLHINFTPTHFNIVPYDSVEYYSNLITDHLVIIGAKDEHTDQHFTPIGRISGLELTAYAVQTLLERNEMKSVPLVVNIIITVLLVFFSELLQSAYLQWSQGLSNKWWNAILSSDVALAIFTFCWLVLLGYLVIIVIGQTGYKVNIGWVISTVLFLDVSRKFVVNTIQLWRES